MAKSQGLPKELLERAITAVSEAWESGCPVAGSQLEAREAIACVFLCRYRTQASRGVDVNDRAAQIRDLAHGMIQPSGQDAKLLGPLICDYEWLAERVLAAVAGI